MAQAQLLHVFMGQPSLVPRADVFQCRAQGPPWLPSQAGFCFRNVELEVVGLVRVDATVLLPACTVAPDLDHMLDDPLHCSGIVVIGAEVPAFGKGLALGVELLR